MLKIKYRIITLAVLAASVVSCKKEGEQYFVSDGSFLSGGLSASSTNIILSAASENDSAVKFDWPPANFGDKPVVKYTLQLDLPSDINGTDPWGHARNFEVGNNIIHYGFIGKDLNNILNAMGMPAGIANDFAVRIKAEVPQYNGSVSSIVPVYTNTLTIKITSYSLSLYIPGDYQGWNPGAAPLLNPVDGRPGMFEGYVNMQGSGMHYFKYTNAPDWNHTNYGDGGNGTFSTDGLAAGLSVPDGGYYELTADFNTNTWTATKTTWGIIGDATPGGWNTDTPMLYDPVNQVWTVTCDMLSNGSYKFRANNAWSIDFGMDPATGKLVYADNPFLGYTAGLWNLSVAQSGNYTITLDLHDSQHYTYSAVRN